MEMSGWPSEIVSANPIHHYQIGSFGDTSEILSSYMAENLPGNGTGSWNSSPKGSSSPHMFSFGNFISPTSHSQYYGTTEDVKPKVEPAYKNFVSDSYQSAYMNQNYSLKAAQGNKRVRVPSTKPTPYSQDHVVAERKRREKLTQRFIALSALVPGLKKIDKASILENAIQYVKELQERVKSLEEQNAKKPMESIVFVKKFQIPSDNDSSSTLPEIVTRVSDKSVLMTIHCGKQNEILDKALAEIKKLKLSVVSSSMTPFGASTVDITVVAEMSEDFNMAVKDLVKKLDSSLRQFIWEQTRRGEQVLPQIKGHVFISLVRF